MRLQRIHLALLVLLCGSTSAFGVCLETHLPVQKEYSGSVFVFTARVISSHFVAASGDGYFLSGTNYTLRPQEILKGRNGEAVTVFKENSSGRFDMCEDKLTLYLYTENMAGYVSTTAGTQVC